MKNVRLMLLSIVRLMLLGIICQTALLAQTVNYTESNEIIANPERGLQKYSITDDSYNASNNYSNLNLDNLVEWRTGNDKVTVLFRYFLLNDFMTTNISDTYLSNMEKDFNTIRNAGMKCIIRFSYSNALSAEMQQPAKDRIISHISQLKPLLQQNKDVILSHQAGFIGTWGEWYYTNSNEFGTDGSINDTQWQNRKEVVDAMLQATPDEIPIQVRYAATKVRMYGSTSLNANTAYQNTPQARIGFFNDAFLNNWGDQGTYSNINSTQNPVGTPDYIYIANETLYTPMTGETNGLNAPRTNASNAVFEMDSLNWSTINRDYFEANWNNWIDDGYYDQILKKLGYRFVLTSSTVTPTASGFNLTLDITNTGFARPFKQRNVYLVLKNTETSDTATHIINTDIRTWEDSISISQGFSLANTEPFQLYLWMPDNDPSLSINSDYSIQFANNGIWDPETGYNNLLQTVTMATVGVNSNSVQADMNSDPNPALGVLTLPVHHSGNVKIFNLRGLLVKEAIVSSNNTVDVTELLKGVYFMHINDEKPIYKFFKQ